MKKDLIESAYEKYKLDWMRSHGFTIKDLFCAIDDYLGFGTDITYSNATELFEEWEFSGNGFGGELWSCYSEFLENEFKDEEYMKSILTAKEFLAIFGDES